MRRSALVALAVLATAAACSKPKQAATTTEPLANTGVPEETPPAQEVAATAGAVDGALWTCQISDYDPQPCKLVRDGDGWSLHKLLGSQRFHGSVTFRPDGGLDFDGKFFCPWGACDAAMKTSFEPDANGYAGTFDNDKIRIEWNEANAGEYGGAGYGGLTGDEKE